MIGSLTNLVNLPAVDGSDAPSGHDGGMPLFLTFLGAAGTVTGSKTLVESGGTRVLVDCGLYQGPRELRERNWEPFPVDPAELDAIVLTHAHLDHCGYLPALVRDGYAGPVLCSDNTADLAAIVLRDSAKLQEEDTAYARRSGYSRHAQPRALYGPDDAEAAITLLQRVPFGEPVPVGGLGVAFSPGGHILGSSTVVIRSADRSVAFSGDLGRPSHPLLREPAPPPAVDAIVLESTYGDRAHEDVQAELDELAGAITRTIKRGGTVLIPAFAVDRTEVLLHALRELQDQQRIPKVPIHADSPMALASLAVYRDAIEDEDAELRSSVIAHGPSVIDLPNLHEATTVDDSKALDRGGARIVVSASGMGSGGRVVHHLKALLPDPRNTVVLVGFQAVGTPGRALLDGAAQLKVHGTYVKVRAEIVSIEAFSVHADAGELVDWVRRAEAMPAQVFCVHGEPDAAAALAERLERELDIVAVVPQTGERVAI